MPMEVARLESPAARATDCQCPECFGLLGATVVFHACVQVSAIGLSLIAVRHTPGVACGIMAASLLAAFWFWRSGRRQDRSRAENDKSSLDRPAPKFVAIAGWVVYLSLIVAACWQHDLSYDGNIYHLPTVHFWAQEGRIHWIDDHLQQAHLVNGYPKGVELLGFVLAQAFGDHGASAANLLFLPLGVFGVACLARLLGASRTWAATAGAVWLLTPVCILQSATTYVDSAYGSCVVAWVAALAVVVAGFRRGGPPCGWRKTLVFGAAAGLCLGTKPTGIAVVGLGFVTATAFLVGQWFPRKRVKSEGLGAGRTLVWLAASVLICCVVGGFWHVRDYLHTGSPFYPCGLSIAGREIFPGKPVSAVAQPERDAMPELRGLPNYQKIFHLWRQYQGWSSRFFAVDSRVGGLGYVWLLGGLPAIVILFARFFTFRRAMNRRVFLVMAFVIGGGFLVQPVNWWPRFTVWILGFGLPCFALLADEVFGRTQKGGEADSPDARRSQRFFGALAKLPRGWVWTCLIVAVVEGTLCGLSVVTGWPAMPHNRREFARIHDIYALPKWKLLWPEMEGTAMERILTGDDAIALGKYGNHRPPHEKEVFIIGGLILPLGERRIVPARGNLCEDDITALRQAGVRYIVWDDDYLLSPAMRRRRVEKAPGFFVVDIR
jgi:hypothetical protein